MAIEERFGRWMLLAATCCLSPLLPLHAAEPMTLWDTVQPSATAWMPDALSQKNGWRKLEGSKPALTGDLCLQSDRLILTLRRGAPAAECYALSGGKPLPVTEIRPGVAASLESFRVLEVEPGRAQVEARFGNAVFCFLLYSGQPFVEARAVENAGKMVVVSRSKYAVLPDAFAGDLVASAPETPASPVRFPNENLLVQLAEGGDAMTVCVWESLDQRITLHLDGAGEARRFAAAEIDFGRQPGGRVWIAALAAPAIWAEHRMGDLHPVKDTALPWKIPFRALWRANYRRVDGIVDSWKCPILKGPDQYEGFDFTPKKARTIWLSARGTFAYPACIDGETCLLRKTRFESRPELAYDDGRAVVVYPCQAIEGSPPGAFGALDVFREALRGTSQASLYQTLRIQRDERDKWPATCGVTEEYEKIFDAGEEQAKKEYLLGRLEAMNHFVVGIRTRMNEYLDWAKRTREWLAKERSTKPELTAWVDEANLVLAEFDKVYEQRRLDERTPAAARLLIAKVTEGMNSSEARESKLEKIKQLGRDTRTIGGNQDTAIGEYRLFTRNLRQRAGYWMTEAQSDAAYSFARELRHRTLEMLRTAFTHEGASMD